MLFPGCSMWGSHRVVTFMCVWELSIEIQGKDGAEDFLFLSVSSPRFVVLVGDFLGFVFVLLKEKFAVSQVEITLLRLAGVVLCSCPQ